MTQRASMPCHAKSAPGGGGASRMGRPYVGPYGHAHGDAESCGQRQPADDGLLRFCRAGSESCGGQSLRASQASTAGQR